MNTSIALVGLLSLPLMGILLYKKRFTGVFCPRSRIVWTILWAILIAQMVASLGRLAFGGWWAAVLPWCGLLLFIYVWARGIYLLLHSVERPTADA
ncbi:MAG: hypothetical protein ABFD16_05030 [Thermoguttaceae bacterium]|jgi:hypothetical protein